MAAQRTVKPRGTPQRTGRGRPKPKARVTWVRPRRPWAPWAIGLGVALPLLLFLVTRVTGGSQTGAFVGGDLHSLVVVPDDPNSVFVGGHQSAAVSRDGGRTFQQVTGLQNSDAMAWSMSDDGSHQVVSGHGGLRTSADGGATWSDRTDQLPGSDVHAVGMDVTAPAHLWAYVVGTGVFSSTDGGQSWTAAGGSSLQLMGPILVRDSGASLLAVDMMQGLVDSRDRGRTWQPVAAGFQAMWIVADPNTPQHLLAAGNGVMSSTDGGATWTSVASAPSGATAVAISKGAHPVWFAAVLSGDHASVFRSGDAGASWQQMTTT